MGGGSLICIAVLYLLPHKVAAVERANYCAFNKHEAREVPAVLDMRAIRTRPLAWSSARCGRRPGR